MALLDEFRVSMHFRQIKHWYNEYRQMVLSCTQGFLHIFGSKKFVCLIVVIVCGKPVKPKIFRLLSLR